MIFLILWACFENFKNIILPIIKSKSLFYFLQFLFFFWKNHFLIYHREHFVTKKKFFEEFVFSFFDFFDFFWIRPLLIFSSRTFCNQNFFVFFWRFFFFFNFLISWACFENLKNIILQIIKSKSLFYFLQFLFFFEKSHFLIYHREHFVTKKKVFWRICFFFFWFFFWLDHFWFFYQEHSVIRIFLFFLKIFFFLFFWSHEHVLKMWNIAFCKSSRVNNFLVIC